ncbi:hypothetical protein BRC83_02230 [Halobacteriales archaeon QS_1_68_17]|nr:MAG: hypothetical protein BRC83_02230 [Halobacteriales archaeon QS_1_68_17]
MSGKLTATVAAGIVLLSAVGPAVGATTATADATTSVTVRNAQVGTLQVGNTTVENVRIRVLRISNLQIQNESAADLNLSRQDDDVVLRNVTFRNLTFSNASFEGLQTASAPETGEEVGQAQTPEGDAGDGLAGVGPTDNVTIVEMSVSDLRVENLSVEETRTDGGLLGGIAEFISGLPDGGGDAAGNETTPVAVEGGQPGEGLVVRTVDVDEMTVRSMAVGTLSVGQEEETVTPGESPTGTPTAGETPAGIDAEQVVDRVTVDSATVDSATIGTLQAEQRSFREPGAAGTETPTETP